MPAFDVYRPMQRRRETKMNAGNNISQEEGQEAASGLRVSTMSRSSFLLLMPFISLPSLSLLMTVRRLVKYFLRSRRRLRFLIGDVLDEVFRIDAGRIGLRRGYVIRLACFEARQFIRQSLVRANRSLIRYARLSFAYLAA